MTNPATKRAAKPNVRKDSPTPEQVKAARTACNQTTWEAANVVYVTTRQWQKYEAGTAVMSPAAFDLYRIMTGQLVVNVAPIVAKA